MRVGSPTPSHGGRTSQIETVWPSISHSKRSWSAYSGRVLRRHAAGIVAKLKAAGLPIGNVIVYTAATDPNHLLGRPNGCLSKASFTDTRVDASQALDSSSGSVDLGGSVEVFDNAADVQARETYIQAMYKADPMLGTEYGYIVGSALIRLSGLLTPDQAATYGTALGG